jgi:hypothetical protein
MTLTGECHSDKGSAASDSGARRLVRAIAMIARFAPRQRARISGEWHPEIRVPVQGVAPM